MVPPSTCLTPREWQVLQLVAEGNQIHEVADELVISIHTARTHCRNVRMRLGARSMANAVFLALVAPPTTYQDTTIGQ